MSEVRVFPAVSGPPRLLRSGTRELQLYSVHGAVSGQVPHRRGPDRPVGAVLRLRATVRSQLPHTRLADPPARRIHTDSRHRPLHLVSIFLYLLFVGKLL